MTIGQSPTSAASAPAAPLAYGPPISLAAARRVMFAAEGEADAHGWRMVIAILDSGGKPSGGFCPGNSCD